MEQTQETAAIQRQGNGGQTTNTGFIRPHFDEYLSNLLNYMKNINDCKFIQ